MEEEEGLLVRSVPVIDQSTLPKYPTGLDTPLMAKSRIPITSTTTR